MTTAKIEKYHLEGNLEGLTTEETCRFVDWDTACKWAATVTEKIGVPYVVLELTDLSTGEVANF